MPTRKLAEGESSTITVPSCKDADHAPPTINYVPLEPGSYEHTCPSCGARTCFTVSGNFRQG